MAAKKLELAVVSIGLITLGLLGYCALPERGDGAARDGERATALEPHTASMATGATGATGTTVPGARAEPDAAEVSGTVRDVLTGEAIGGVSIAFRGRDDAELVAVSDTSGRYTLHLSPGRYRVRAVGTDVVAIDDAQLAIAPRLDSRTLDIEVLRLARVQGRVVDGDGEPLADVAIVHRTTVLDRVLEQADTEPAGRATSARDGVFHIEVPPGEVELIARTAGKPESTTTIRWVEPGARLSGVEIVMDAGATLSGTVVDPAGEAVAGARVTGHSSDARQPVYADTAGDGTFVLRDLVPGQVFVRARAPGFAPSPAVEVRVDRADRDDGVVLTLREAHGISGRVVDPSGAAIAGATVRAEPMTPMSMPTTEVKATTDAAGVFTLGGLGREPLMLTARADGFAPARQSGVTAPGHDIEIALTHSSTLTGAVTGPAGPLYDFAVRLERRDDGSYQSSRFRVASADGTYRLEDIAPGTYRVTLSAPGLAPQVVRNVRLPAGGEAQASAELGAGATVTGTVTHAKTGAPVSGAMVRLSTGSETPATYSDASGAFTIADIAPGRRSLEVRHPGFVGKIASGIELTPDKPASVDIALEPLRFGADATIEFAGIGAAISMEDEQLMVSSLVPHGPAEVAGLLAGDEITHIDGQTAHGRTLADNIEDIRGVAGTVVRLVLRRGDMVFERDVVRGTVRFTPSAPPEPGQ